MTYAELTLRLRQRDNSLIIHATFSSPGWQTIKLDQQLPQPDPVILREAQLDHETYGRHLTQMIFANQELVTFVQKAHVAAHNVLRLRIDLSIHDTSLLGYHWETLFDVVGGQDAPICTSERLLFSRYLSNDTFRPIHRSARPEHLKALVVVADPSDLAQYQLAKIDVESEIARVRRVLQIPTTILARGADGLPTLETIAKHLRAGPHILYLVCHGTWRDHISYLWLEDHEGKHAWVSANHLIELIKGLRYEQIPLLVMLMACESMGRAHDPEMIAAIGPQLASVGVPAVVAMNGPITMRAADKFTPIFFNELLRHGEIDRAMAVARFALRDGREWCIPVLFMGMEDGTLWQDMIGLEERGMLRQGLIGWWRKKYIVTPRDGDLDALVDSILNCRSYRSAAVRRDLLQTLGTAADGLDEMIEILRISEQNSLEMQQLDELLQRIDYRPIERKRLAQLYPLLAKAGITEDDINLLREIYGRCMSITSCPTGVTSSELLRRIIYRLAEESIQPGKSQPLLRFLLLLAPFLDLTPELRDALENWCSEIAQFLGCELDLKMSVPEQMTPVQLAKAEAYLFIVLEPVSILKAEPFTVRALLLPDGREVDKPGSYLPVRFNRSDETFTYEQLPKILAEIVDSAEGMVGEKANPMVEIFLPIPLLLCDFDRIQIQRGFCEECLGVLYPLVVRPIELLVPKASLNASRREWQQRWQEWKIGRHSLMLLQRIEQCDDRHLLAELRAGSYTCFASTFVPKDASLASKMCSYLLQTGVPIALIHRGDPDTAELVHDTLKQILTPDAVKKLPTLVLEQRKQAQISDSEQDPGHRLTLVWNNPNRCPPVTRLEAP